MGGKKGGGGKGKKGGICPEGDVAICLDNDTWDKAKSAFNGGTASSGPSDGCPQGQIKVCMDRDAANQLLFALAISLQTGAIKKKKKKGKGKGKS